MQWWQDLAVRAAVKQQYEEGVKPAAMLAYVTGEGYAVPGSSLRRYCADQGWKRPTAASEPPDPEGAVEAAVAAEQYRQSLRAQERILAEMTQAEARKRNWLQALRDAAAVLPAPEEWQPRPEDERKATPHALILQWTDLHAGKWVDPGVVGSRFSYDRFILEESVERWLDAVRRIVAIHRQAYPVDDVHILALGDMVEGSDMRPQQKVRLDHQIGTIGRQTVYTGRLIGEVVRELRAQFQRVFFVGVGGNHGRVGKHGENEVVDNFDWLAYHFAEESCREIPGVRFYIPDTPTALLRIGGKTFFLQHGDAIRSWGESPANAVKRAVRKDAFAQEHFPDYSLMGHFHQSISFQAGGRMRVYMGGNWDGGDGYCVHNLKDACEPSQNAFLFHPDRGIVAQYEIALREGPARPAEAVELELLTA